MTDNNNAIKSAAVLFLFTAACGPLPPDVSDGTTGYEEVTTSGETCDDDNSEAYSDTSAASTTGDTDECVDSPCTFKACDDGKVCMPNPANGVPTCVGSCESLVALCEAEVCGEPVPGVCVKDPLGLGWCYPI